MTFDETANRSRRAKVIHIFEIRFKANNLADAAGREWSGTKGL